VTVEGEFANLPYQKFDFHHHHHLLLGTKIQYSAKLKTWTVKKTHQAQTSSYGGL